MSKLMKIEYRVKEKTSYFVTRYCKHGTDGDHAVSITQEGWFEDNLSAQRAAIALTEWEKSLVSSDGVEITGPDPLPYSRVPS